MCFIDTAHSASGTSFFCCDGDDNDGLQCECTRMIFLCSGWFSILYAQSATTNYSEGILFQTYKILSISTTFNFMRFNFNPRLISFLFFFWFQMWYTIINHQFINKYELYVHFYLISFDYYYLFCEMVHV